VRYILKRNAKIGARYQLLIIYLFISNLKDQFWWNFWFFFFCCVYWF